MFVKRKIESEENWLDPDGIKIYNISVNGEKVEKTSFYERLEIVKGKRRFNWKETPGFAIFHEGESCAYLILDWWDNDNELFTSVSALTDTGWVEDSSRFSFCVFDLEVFWAERNIYIETIYCKSPGIALYRKKRSTSVQRAFSIS